MAAKIKVDQLESVDGSTNLILNNSVTMASGKTLPAASLTGALPAISAASLTAIPAGNLTGTIAIARIADGTITAAKLAADTATQAELDAVSTVASAALPKAGGTMTGTLAAASVTVAGNAVGTLTTDNDGSFSMSASNNFKCTPSGNFTLTFTNIVAQSGNILLVNSGGHTVSAHANTKVDAKLLSTVSSAGTYLLAYFSDGTNVYMTNSAVYT
jgi:hypothetical protein